MPFLENDAVLTQMNQQFGGNYLNEEAVAAAERAPRGTRRPPLAMVGPAHIFDVTESSGQITVNIDDATGPPAGIPLSVEVQAILTAANLPTV